MTVSIKTPHEIQLMREVGKLAAKCLREMGELVKEGNTPRMLDDAMNAFCAKHGAIPATLNYRGFPASLCVSVNNVVCHGIPNDTPFKNGDIVNVDVTPKLNGYHGDTNATFIVGETSPQAKKLVDAAYEAMWEGIRQVRPGNTVGDIGFAISSYAKSKGYSVVYEYCGHGIGSVFHEDLVIEHIGKPKRGIILKPGMTFTIEPMINAGHPGTTLDLRDGWTVYTMDGSLSAQFEHTVLVTDDGVEVLTLDTESKDQSGKEEIQDKDQEGRLASKASSQA